MPIHQYLAAFRIEQCSFDRPDYHYVTDPQKVADIQSALGMIADDFDSFFVGGEEYEEVWGVVGKRPTDKTMAYQIL